MQNKSIWLFTTAILLTSVATTVSGDDENDAPKGKWNDYPVHMRLGIGALIGRNGNPVSQQAMGAFPARVWSGVKASTRFTHEKRCGYG